MIEINPTRMETGFYPEVNRSDIFGLRIAGDLFGNKCGVTPVRRFC